MTKFLALTVGLLIAAAAFFALSGDSPVSDVASAPPHEPIDDASRAKLDSVLRDAER